MELSKRNKHAKRQLQFEPLERRLLLAANPVITEFMASNGNTLNDGNGDTSDWIEIYNAGNEAVDLVGWHLTDDPADLNKWTFPTAVLEAGEHMLVLASGNNAPDAQGYLHTNFLLSAGGEYLALVEPDEMTIATEFGPGGTDYPSQFRDISYGLSTDAATTELISPGDTSHSLVPADDTLEETWYLKDFAVDGSWTTGPTGAGFTTEHPNDELIGTDLQEEMFGENATAYIRVPFNVPDQAALDQLDELTLGLKFDDGFIAYLNGTEVGRYAAPDDPAYDSTAVPAQLSVVLADARADFDDHTPVDGQTSVDVGISDSIGDGAWNFFGSVTENPTSPDAGLTPLVFRTTQPHSVVAANSYVDPAQDVYYLPGVKNDTLILPVSSEGTPAVDELALHPGEYGRTYNVTRWTAGPNSAGDVNLDGTLRELGTIGDGVTLSIFADGIRQFGPELINTLTGVDFDVDVTVADGDNVDFVVGKNDSFGNDHSAMSIKITRPTNVTVTPSATGVLGVVAELRDDYDAHAPVVGQTSVDVGISDSIGDGAWNFFSSATVNPSEVGAGLAALTFTDVPPHAVVDVPSYLDVSQSFGLPGINNHGLILPENLQGAPNADELALHPGQGGQPRTFMVSRWTAGPSSAGQIDIEGAFRGNGASDKDWRIFVDGELVFSQNSGETAPGIPPQTATFLLEDLTITAGQHVDFVVGLGAGNDFSGDHSFLSTTISVVAPPIGVQGYFDAQIDVSDYVDLLEVGENVVAIQGLNLAADDSDFLVAPTTLTGISQVKVNLTQPRYFLDPTPGEVNNIGTGVLGPRITDVAHFPNVPADDQDLTVTARITPTNEPVGEVTLIYRAMYGTEAPLEMVDDGTMGDQAAGDGVFTAVIPHTAAAPGEMIRYRIDAVDVSDASSRSPLFLDQQGENQSAEYHGTIVGANLDTEMDVLHWFVAPGTEGAAQSDDGTRTSLFYDGEFYDNAFVRRRGDSSSGYLKVNFKFEMNTGEHFRFHPDFGRVEEFNVNASWSDKSFIRRVLAWETYAQAGSPYSYSFPLRMEQNGQFFSVATFVEQPDEEYFERQGINSDGSLYKMLGSQMEALVATEERMNKDGDFSDLQALIDGVSPSNPNRTQFVYDNVDLPRMFNYLAASVVMHENDHMAKNYYMYRDDSGSGQWFMLPWDKDLVYGKNWVPTAGGVFSDLMWADNDQVPGRSPPVSPSHPLFGDSDHQKYDFLWNRLIDAIYDDPTLRSMYLRRLRSVMDDILQPPGTPADQLKIDARIDELYAQMESDVALDRAKWGNAYGTDYGFELATRIIKEEVPGLEGFSGYLPRRRVHLYETHSIDNLSGSTGTTILASGAPATAFVPTDDSLGLDWIQSGFSDAGWIAGTTGVGYERTAGYEGEFGIDLLAASVPQSLRIDADGDGVNENDSVYIRVPFNVPDPAAIDQLTLKMKYDDGFVAYINGTRVADANEPATPAWNSGATTFHGDSQALVFENFSIASPGTLLQAGENILAIHALNDNTANGPGMSSDMLIVPELVEGNAGGNVNAAGIPHGQVGHPTINFGALEYNPASGIQDEEYIELVNPGDAAVDISGWRLVGGVEHAFKSGTVIPAGDSLYVSPNVVAFRARTTGPSGGQGLFVQGNYNGHLSNVGETIDLLATDGSVVATITTPSMPSNAQRFLRVTEIHYHPADATPAEVAAGFDDGDLFEFIELRNTSDTTTLDLAGVRFTDGISFTFGDVSLPPGGFVLLVSNAGAFAERYGSIPVAGQYGGNLSNGGERLHLDDAEGGTIHDFDYDDNGVGWHPATDGSGPSLVIVNPLGELANWRQGDRWRASFEPGGSPGRTDVMLGDFDGDFDVDLADLVFLQRRLGTAGGATTETGDLTGDGAVDRSDVARFVRNYGRASVAPVASASPVAALAVVRSASEATPLSQQSSLRARIRRTFAAPRIVDAVFDDIGSPLDAGSSRDVSQAARNMRRRRD